MRRNKDLMHRHPHGEEGVTVIFVAISLVFLMVFVAFAVDLGAVYVERRNDQNSVDAGVLAGVGEVAQLTVDEQTITDQVLAHVHGTLNRTISDADWVAKCSTSEPPAGFTALKDLNASVVPATRCVSISATGAELRVALPIQTTNTSFGRVVGINSFGSTAFAQAGIAFPGLSQSPPFVVPDGAGSGQEVCLRTGGPSAPDLPLLPYDSNGNGTLDDLDPCSEAAFVTAPALFGTLLPTTYKEFSPSNPVVACTTGNDNKVAAIADGIDHPLSHFANPPGYTGAGAGERQDGVGCGGPGSTSGVKFPNTMVVDSGLSTANLTCGMLGRTGGGCTADGINFDGVVFTPRLRRGSFLNASYQFTEKAIDDRALWHFLADLDALSAPATCKSLENDYPFNTFRQNKELLLQCLASWTTSNDPLFTELIVNSARFTFLPLLDEASLAVAPSCTTGGGTCVHFNDFVPAFFTRLYSRISGGGTHGACDPGGPGTRWGAQEPGDGVMTCAQAGDTLDRVAGIVFNCEMLPANICDDAPPSTPGPGGDPVLNIRLTK